eukprot:765764-Hanusia_phi.AAC.2
MRKSLAPVSASSLNSRSSLAPRASLAPGKASLGRQSTLGGFGTRKSSIGGRQSMAPGGRRSTLAAGGPSKQMEDPRNVKDKTFINAAKHRLIEFLVENNYDRQISLKQLDAPTTKDYLHILMFLYNKIDPKFQLSQNIAEDVPAMFRRLRYPFNVSKSHLQAVGSPHAWPSLLASLVWIVELLQYEKQVEIAMMEDPESEHPDKMFFDYLAKAYDAFLQGSDNDEYIEQELAQAFDAKNEATQEEVNRISTANRKMEEEIQELSESKLEELQTKRSLLQKDLEKFKLLITNLEKHLVDVEKKTVEIKEDASAKEAELKAAEVEKAHLQEVVGQQETKAIDAQRIAAERGRLQEDLRKTSAEKESLQNNIYNAEITLANKQADIEKQIQEYNRTATEMKIVPATAKHADGIAFDIPVASRGNGVDQLIALGGKSSLKQDLVNLRDSFLEKAQEVHSQRMEGEEKVRDMQMQVEEKKEEIANLEEECRTKEQLLVRDKELLEMELKNTATEVQALEEMVASGMSMGKARLVAAKKKVEELQREFKEVQSGYQRRRSARSDSLMALCSLAAQHKLNVQVDPPTLLLRA